MSKDFSERNAAIEDMRASGATFKEIGDQFNLSGQRIRQIVILQQQRRAQERIAISQPLRTLKTRAQNALLNHLSEYSNFMKEYPYPDTLSAPIDALPVLSKYKLIRTPNLGKKALKEISELLERHGIKMRD